MKSSLRSFVFLVAFLVCEESFPFPEMVRHGYLSCVACHYNSNGGGILRPFGRAIAGDVLSTWSRENESDFLYGLVPLPEWLNAGADVRWIQTYRDTPAFREGRTILMQADLELAASLKQWSAVVSGGPNGRSGDFLSRRHYLLFRSEDEPRLYLQAGRFSHAFGINTPDHVIATKRGLGWDDGSETLNLQGAWMDQAFDIFLTANLGRPDQAFDTREKGAALRYRHYLGSTTQVGGSYFFGISNTSHRNVFGPFATIGFSDRFFILVEADAQNANPASGASTWGLVNYLRVNYEAFQGIHFFLTQEYSNSDFSDADKAAYALGVGTQLFLRPHFEVNAQWQKLKTSGTTYLQDWAWLMLHFYL